MGDGDGDDDDPNVDALIMEIDLVAEKVDGWMCWRRRRQLIWVSWVYVRGSGLREM